MWNHERGEPEEPDKVGNIWRSRLDWRWLLGVRPSPLPPPTFPNDLRARAGPTRLVMMLGYQVRRLEYLLNPGGQLRAWALFNLRVLLVVLIPALGIFPLLALLLAELVVDITQLLAEAVTWSELLVLFLIGILEALLLLLAIYVTMVMITLFSRWWNQRRRW